MHKRLNGPLRSLIYSPDGKYLVTARGLTGSSEENSKSKGSVAWVLDATSGDVVTELNHHDNINGIAYSPDGKYLATCSDDKTSRVGNSISGEMVRSFEHDVSVTGIRFSDDGQFLVTITDKPDALPRVWDVQVGRKKMFARNSLMDLMSSIRMESTSSPLASMVIMSGR